MIWISGIFVGVLAALFVLALCRAGGEADDRMHEIARQEGWRLD